MIRRAVALLVAMLGAGAAWAGPPYVTDDPEPTEFGKWEVYAFGQGTHFAHATEGSAGFDINYGAAKDLQVSTTIEVEHDGGRTGFGDLELGLKYRVLHQKEDSWMPDVSLYPQLTLPTARHDLGAGHVGVALPIWAQKDFGPWSLFGGGEYVVNPGPTNRDYNLIGLAATRDVSKR